MPKKQPQLAKLTRPRLHKATARERLFTILDEAHDHKAAICIVGPPGAGKTTLVASWLDARDIKGIWYQVDAGDADLATFFHYLGEAAKSFSRKGQRPLPALTPEYMQDVAGFARRFFREFFARLPPGATLVLDNYQEVDADERFHHIVAQAVDDVSAGLTLVAVSRRDPPDCYARLIANENVRFVDWEELKLSFEEAHAMAAARASIPDADLRLMHEQCGGWAAGLTLMLEGSRRGAANAPGLLSGREAIFSYFAAQIFERVSAPTRQFLVATALLPQVPVSVARELTGNSEAGSILEDLYRRHLFTHRRSGAESTYWYHALFRSFLKDKAHSVLSPESVLDVARRGARLLEARGAFDDAFQLFHETGDWQASRRLIERHASELLAQGRGQTLRDWILLLPQNEIESAPWLRYWLGTSLIQLEQEHARSHLERAFDQFAVSGEAMGQALSAAGVIDSYVFEWSDFRPMRRWVDTLDPLLDRMHFSGDSGSERRIYTSLLLGMLYAAPDHRLLSRTVERVTEMLDEEMDVNSKVAMAMSLLSYCNIACDMERGKIAVACADRLLDHPELTPFNQLWWQLRKGYYFPIIGQYLEGRDALDRAGALSEKHGLQGLRRTFLLIASYRISCCAMIGDVRDARKWHERMTAMASRERPMDAWHVTQSRVHLECSVGNYRAVVEGSRQAVEMAADAGMRYIEILGVEHEATGLAVLGELDRLDESLLRLRRLISGTCFAFLECHARLLEAYAELVHGPGNGHDRIREAITFARKSRFQYTQMARYSIVTGVVFVEALRIGVEKDYVGEVIRSFRIPSPSESVECWPWPVKVHALGTFELRVNEELVTFAGKAPKKPLALLKALITNGGRNVPEERLIDALWPDEEADAARKSLDITVLRLRKLLGDNESVLVANELVSLNPRLCWTDVWAFEHGMEQFESGTREVGDAAGVLSLYRGGFLPADIETPWTTKARERLRGKFVRLVEVVALEQENAGRWEQAIHSYLRGLEADDLVEPFYQGLMRCYRSLGRHAEAMGTYRKLRHLLSVVLGISPSESSQALAAALQRDNPAQFDNP